MEAAARGKSDLGIPAKVGKEFVRADDATAANANGHAAGVVFCAPNGRLLLVMRAASEKNYPGHWSLPGGKGEPGESPVETAMRECAEEIGDSSKHAWMGAPTLLSSVPTPTGMTFHTYAQPVRYEFAPELNSEHSGYLWTSADELPSPMHPGVIRALIQLFGTEVNLGDADRLGRDPFAMDRQSIRSYDADGRLHVTQTPISKANICEYKGDEIPNARMLGLQPDRRYRLWRDPGELAKAASTFNLLPILRRHVPTSAEDHKKEDTIGATGTDAAFEAPFLVNSLVIWPASEIKDIEADLRKELSCAYRYRADMTPGIVNGESYDGVMRDISGNHVALVREGRAGPDVVVGDEKPRPDNKFAAEDGFQESDHPRDDDGKFAESGGGSSSVEFAVSREIEPRRIEPVNEVDPKHVEAIAARMKKDGWQGRPILTYEGADGVMAITGSHRIAAAEEAGISVPTMAVSDDVLYYVDGDGNSLADLVGTGDDRPLVKFLREAEDDSAADLVQAEIDANKNAHDSKEPAMAKIALSPKATLVRGALVTFLTPRLAADAAIDLPPLLKAVTNKNWAQQRPKLMASVSAAVTGKLAADADLDGLSHVLMALDSVDAPDMPMPGGGKGAGPGDKKAKDKKMGKDAAEALKEKLKDRFGADEDGYKAACDDIDGMMGGEDEEDDDDDDEDVVASKKAAAQAAKDKKAKDAKRARDAQEDDDDDDRANDDKDEDKMGKEDVQKAMDEAIAGERKRADGVRDALRFVRPYVGDLDMAFDSATDVLTAALKIKGRDAKKYHPDALRDVLATFPKAGAVPSRGPGTAAPIAMDAKSTADIAKRYPRAAAIRLGGPAIQ